MHPASSRVQDEEGGERGWGLRLAAFPTSFSRAGAGRGDRTDPMRAAQASPGHPAGCHLGRGINQDGFSPASRQARLERGAVVRGSRHEAAGRRAGLAPEGGARVVRGQMLSGAWAQAGHILPAKTQGAFTPGLRAPPFALLATCLVPQSHLQELLPFDFLPQSPRALLRGCCLLTCPVNPSHHPLLLCDFLFSCVARVTKTSNWVLSASG